MNENTPQFTVTSFPPEVARDIHFIRNILIFWFIAAPIVYVVLRAAFEIITEEAH